MANLFWVPGGDGNWASNNNWSDTSGGAGGFDIPSNIYNTIVFDANSGSGTSTLDGSFDINSIDFTSFTGTWTGGAGLTFTAEGNITFGLGMTITINPDFFYWANGNSVRTTLYFTSNGKTLPVTLNVGGSGFAAYAMADSFVCNGGISVLLSGGIENFYTNNQSISCLFIANLTGSCQGNIYFGTSVITITGKDSDNGNAVTVSFQDTTSVDASRATFIISDTSSSMKSLYFASVAGNTDINTLTITGNNVNIFFGTNNITYLKLNNAGQSIGTLFQDAQTFNIVGNFSTNGSAGNLVKMSSITPGSQYTLDANTNKYSVSFTSIQDAAGQNGTWNALILNGCVDVSGNTGITFSTPLVNSNMFLGA